LSGKIIRGGQEAAREGSNDLLGPANPRANRGTPGRDSKAEAAKKDFDMENLFDSIAPGQVGGDKSRCPIGNNLSAKKPNEKLPPLQTSVKNWEGSFFPGDPKGINKEKDVSPTGRTSDLTEEALSPEASHQKDTFEKRIPT
jgi:hypothetical protein